MLNHPTLFLSSFFFCSFHFIPVQGTDDTIALSKDMVIWMMRWLAASPATAHQDTETRTR
jgi:hypothetical protein